MKTTPSSPRVTSAGVIKGAMVQETYAAFRSWDFAVSKKANLDRIREENLVGAPTSKWLTNVLWNISSRFDPEGRDRPLVLLAQQGVSMDLWKPLLLWHVAQSEFLVRDFLVNFLFPQVEAGGQRFKPEQVEAHFAWLLKPNALVKAPWAASTLRHVASGLLKFAATFGLLEGGTVKTSVPHHLPDACVLYILHALVDRKVGLAKIVDVEDWRIFLMTPQAVHQELLRLHQYRKVDYQTAGSLVELRLPAADLLAFAKGWPI
jgi:hypothetical protein